MDIIFDSADVPVHDRVGAWVETTALALVTTRLTILDPAAFGARLQAMPLGAVHMNAMSYGPLLSQRTPRLIRQSDPERYLHRICQQHGTSVSAYIKCQRLDRCRRDLADPHVRHLTISSIASRWGFPRPSDFTRAFRTAVGMSPSQYRATAQSNTAMDILEISGQNPDGMSWKKMRIST